LLPVNLNKTNPSNQKRTYYRREYYENTHLDVGVGAIRINWLRRRNAASCYDHDNYDDHARGDHGGSDGRGCDA